MDAKKIAMLYNGAHPVHQKFGDSVRAKPLYIRDRVTKGQNAFSKSIRLIKNVLSLPENFSFMLTESCYYYPAFKRKLGGMKKTKIINLNCSPIFYNLLNGVIKGMEKNILLDLEKEIDAHLVLGEYGRETVRKIDGEKPIRVVYPFISNENYERLTKTKPNLTSKNIAIIATNDYKYKGLDIAVEAVKRAWEEDKEIRLNIVGNINKKIIDMLSTNHPAVNYLGFVDDLAKTLGESALYFHPARGDTFPVSVLEAMAAGLPTLVSRETGTKEAIEKADRKFVCKTEPQPLSKFILEYFTYSYEKKEELSRRFRKEADFYNEKTQLKLFKDRCSLLLSEIK